MCAQHKNTCRPCVSTSGGNPCRGAGHACVHQNWLRKSPVPTRGLNIDKDTLPEWSKGVDSSSTSASCAGSNPAGVRFYLLCVPWMMQPQPDSRCCFSRSIRAHTAHRTSYQSYGASGQSNRSCFAAASCYTVTCWSFHMPAQPHLQAVHASH